MDIGTALVILSPEPVEVHEQYVHCATMVTSLPLALDMLDEATRQAWLQDHPDAPLSLRVQLALEQGRLDKAWELCRQLRGGLRSDPLTSSVLNDWASTQLRELELRSQGAVLLQSDSTGALRAQLGKESNGALRDVQLFTEALSWPFWQGPLVVIDDDRAWPGLTPDQDLLSRPALPVIRLGATADWREDCAAAIIRIILDRQRRATGDWPPWLSLGLQEIARAKARGEGPSPRAMLSYRQGAGKEAMVELLGADSTAELDTELAKAICAPLVHTLRRRQLASFMDLLRNGADSAKAIEIAYGLSLDDLLSKR